MGEYTGTWIPKAVMEDENLKPVDKILYAEIASFIDCFASNKFLAERVGLSERGVQDAIKRLRDLDYITSTAFNGRTRTLVATQNLRGSTTPEREAAPRQDVDIDNSIENKVDNTMAVIKKEDIPEVIEIADSWQQTYGFKMKSPASEKLFIRKLIKNYGADRTTGAITAAYAIREMEYAPVITSFRDLWYKWEKLEAFYRRKATTQAKRSVEITN